MLVGSESAVTEARVWRKRLGGGMRQVGILAAGAAYALDHHLERLAEDHDHARLLAEACGVDPAGVDTNIVVVDRPRAVVRQSPLEKRGVCGNRRGMAPPITAPAAKAVRGGAARGAASTAKREGLTAAGYMDDGHRHTAQAGARRLANTQSQRRGNRGVNGVATGRQHLNASRCRQIMRRGDHAARRGRRPQRRIATPRVAESHPVVRKTVFGAHHLFSL
jgi:hypothetical protein